MDSIVLKETAKRGRVLPKDTITVVMSGLVHTTPQLLGGHRGTVPITSKLRHFTFDGEGDTEQNRIERVTSARDDDCSIVLFVNAHCSLCNLFPSICCIHSAVYNYETTWRPCGTYNTVLMYTIMLTGFFWL